MNRHVGASFTLSVLVVVFFAVILYEPERARTAAPPLPVPDSLEASPTNKSHRQPQASPSSSPPPARSPNPPSLNQALIAPRKIMTPPPRVSAAPPAQPPITPDPPAVIQASPIASLPLPAAIPPSPKSANGESLTDVALRVYGTSEATNALWRANRDIIAHRETPLDPGLLLRTP